MPSDMPVRQNFGNWGLFLSAMGKTPIKFIPTKNGITRKGVRNKSRKRILDARGYIQIFEPSHPTAMSNGYCLEHRMMAWDAGILTDLADIVHHSDEVKTNNVTSNFQSMPNGKHTSMHHKGRKKTRKHPELLEQS